VSNVEQIEYWNGPEGQYWVDREEQFDRMLTPFVEPLLRAVALQPSDRVLDVGCGNGALSRAAAPDAGSVVGLDISALMIGRAREQAAAAGITNVEFIEGDAQTHDFDGEFHVILSRFGVMFFEDPEAAFANLAAALVPGGRMALVCWQDAFANQWVAVPGATLIPIVGPPDVAQPGAPGPFAFADRDLVAGILQAGGFTDVAIDELRTSILLGGGLDVDGAVDFFAQGGMGKRFLGEADHGARARSLDALRDALGPFMTPEGVRLDAAAWLVQAKR
jgi:SAM-dependent methyltransferase